MNKIFLIIGYVLFLFSCNNPHNNTDVKKNMADSSDTITIKTKPLKEIEIVKLYTEDSSVFSYTINLVGNEVNLAIKTTCLNYNLSTLAYDYPVVNQELKFLFDGNLIIDSSLNKIKKYRNVDGVNRVINEYIINYVTIINSTNGDLIYISGTDDYINHKEFFMIFNARGEVLWSIFCEPEAERKLPKEFGNLDSVKLFYKINDTSEKKQYNRYSIYPLQFAGSIDIGGIMR